MPHYAILSRWGPLSVCRPDGRPIAGDQVPDGDPEVMRAAAVVWLERAGWRLVGGWVVHPDDDPDRDGWAVEVDQA